MGKEETRLTTTEQDVARMIENLRSAAKPLAPLIALVASYVSRGCEMPRYLRDESQRVSYVISVLNKSLRRYGSLLAELYEPGRLAADVRICADPTASDGERLAAIERMTPLFVDGVYRRLRRGSRGDFYRCLRMEAPHLSPGEALKRRIRSCLLIIAKEVCESVTLGEFVASGHEILRRTMDKALPEDVIGPWYHTAANPVEELTPDHHDPGPSPDVMAELELLPRATGLTPMERLVVDIAVRLRSALPREIANHAGITPAVVRVHWCNARRKLRSEES